MLINFTLPDLATLQGIKFTVLVAPLRSFSRFLQHFSNPIALRFNYEAAPCRVASLAELGALVDQRQRHFSASISAGTDAGKPEGLTQPPSLSA
jgi:hypothetical protein